MPDFLGFGDGRDGAIHISSDTNDTVIVANCSGSSGSTSLTATNPSFAAGQMVVVMQMFGSGAGNRQFNIISSYVAGTITLAFPLDNNFGLVGSAQVLVIKQCTSLLIDSTKSLVVNAHDESTHRGGIFAAFVNGQATIDGYLQGNGINGTGGVDPGQGGLGCGYWGGDGARHTITPDSSDYGGSSVGESSRNHTNAHNGAGGGAGYVTTNSGAKRPGGGGGHKTDAGAGTSGSGTGSPGEAGTAVGNDDMSTIFMGGGGGGGCTGDSSSSFKTGGGGGGGGIIILFARKIVVTGGITALGGNGGDADNAGGGGGAGGSIWLKGVELSIGTGLVDVTGGLGGTTGGGNGSVGRVRIESCTLTGESTPSSSKVTGGHSFCFSGSAIL